MKELSLKELLVRYQLGNLDAFREFFDRTNIFIYNFLAKRLRNRSDADDVMQDTYLRIHRYISGYDPAQGAMAWIMTVAKNAFIDHLAKAAPHSNHSRVDALSLRSAEISPEDRILLQDLMKKAFGQLSDEDIELLFARFCDEMSHQEIAKDLNIKDDNARQKLSRLTKRLKAILSSE